MGDPPNVGLSTTNLLQIPKGFSFIRQQTMNGKNGSRIVHIIKENATGKFKILEDLAKETKKVETPKVNLKNYNGEKLTGNEEGFEQWAWSRIPETDHFPDLSHGLENPKEVISIVNNEFESLPNGSRIDLGKIFSGDISSNLLQFVRRNPERIKMVLPKDLNARVRTNSHGIKGTQSADNFNYQLEKLLERDGYPYDIVSPSIYDINTNTLDVPALSFIKLKHKGGKIWN